MIYSAQVKKKLLSLVVRDGMAHRI